MQDCAEIYNYAEWGWLCGSALPVAHAFCQKPCQMCHSTLSYENIYQRLKYLCNVDLERIYKPVKNKKEGLILISHRLMISATWNQNMPYKCKYIAGVGYTVQWYCQLLQFVAKSKTKFYYLLLCNAKCNNDNNKNNCDTTPVTSCNFTATISICLIIMINYSHTL